MNQKPVLSLLFILFSCFASAQHQELDEKPETYKEVKFKDTTHRSLLHAFKNGSINGHFRYFFMATDNEKGLSDYYANAAGGGIRYESASFHGFSVAVSGFYIFNIASSDLGKKDSLTGQSNRYEIGLFDIENPEDKSDLDRLEEFHIKYTHKKSWAAFGRQLINTPFINLQDGRMRPTGVNGAWFVLDEGRKISAEGGWLYSITPRGTTRWFDIGESIGVLSAGVNPDGTPSGYAGNLKSAWVGMINLNYSFTDNFKVSAWNMFTKNIYNSFLLEADWSKKLSDGSRLTAALQAIRQDAVKDGGNADPSKTYFPAKGKSMVFSGKLGWKKKAAGFTLSYTRITGHGRYLVPREWGRDPMFTFMPRERNEGLGDVHAIVGRIDYAVPRSALRTSVSAGYYSLPAVNDYRLNKYGMPSYLQLNLDMRYRFKGVLQGLESQLLIVGKKNEESMINDKKYIINKVNLIHTSFLLNFYF